MSGLILFLGIVLFILGTAFSLYVRWWLGRAVNEEPRVEVRVTSDATATLARITTRGTRRQFRLKRLRAPSEGADLEPPEGFRPAQPTSGVTIWEPRRPIILPPGHPLDLRIRHAPGDSLTVRGEAESKLAVGGTSVEFSILVRERDRDRRELFNRRSALYAVAAERGVAPRELPEWERVEKLERRLADDSSSSTPPEQ